MQIGLLIIFIIMHIPNETNEMTQTHKTNTNKVIFVMLSSTILTRIIMIC